MFKRIILFVTGLFIMSLGVAFSIVSGLGTTPISSLSYSLTLITGINIGITTFLFNVSLILIQFLILKSKFHKKRLLQLINCILFGYFTDVALYIVSAIPLSHSIFTSVLFLIISILLIAFGIFVYMPANIAPLPGEGCVEALAIVSNIRFSTLKILFDASIVISSLILCGLFYSDIFASVNIGTLISAFLVGFTLRQISNLCRHITGHEINVVNK